MKTELFDHFPCLEPLKEHLAKLPQVTLAKLPKGAQIFAEGDPCQMIAFVLSGVVRVFKLSETGREMTLYRIIPGESCILSISSLMSENPLPAIAQVEEEVEVLITPAQVFLKWMKEEPSIQGFVFDLLSRRLSDVLATVEEVAFHRVDERILRYLLLHRQGSNIINTTHLKIATDVASSREVVSRILKDLESQGLLQIHRGSIELLNEEKIKKRLER